MIAKYFDDFVDNFGFREKIGLVQPIEAVMPMAEIQSEWIADLLEGRATLPPEREMNREIARYRAVTAKRYARSTRHAIQVDFLAYLREIRRERQVGARRNGVSRTIAVAPPAPRILQPATTSSQA
jgi:dimethylaniline monooxygenase (N-oxide forming)